MARLRVLPYLLIAPAVLFLLALFVMPLVQTMALAFTGETGGFSLGPFQKMAGDLNFWPALRNTFALVVAVVPMQIALALGMGLMLQKMAAGRDLVLWIWTIPLGISDLAAGLVWLVILSDTGFLNSALYSLGLLSGKTAWLTYEHPVTLFLGIVAAEVWRATAIVLVVLVAGLQLIPKEYAEAAEIFGAGPWTRFRRITLPLLKPSLQSALILRTVLAFEVFGVVYALGGSNLPVLAGEAYVWQNTNQNYAVAAAYAVLIMAVSLAATAVYLRLLRTPEEARP
ncbi:MAG: sugar ABC transporter permease [Alsobacter sp.]